MTALLIDLALDGAISGFVAVLLMTLFEIPFWHRFGMPGVVQWQVNEILTSKLLSEPYIEGKRIRGAIGMHLLHGIILGTIFPILLRIVILAEISSVYLLGLGYSFALWLVVPFALRNWLEWAGRTKFTKLGLAVSLLAHLIYGFALGEVLSIFLR